MDFNGNEQYILNKYAEILSNKGYRLEQNYKIEEWKEYVITLDAVIKDEKNNIISIIEINNNSQNKERIIHEIDAIALKKNIQFYIIINFLKETGKPSYIQELYSIKRKISGPINIFKDEEGVHQIIDNLINKYNKDLFINDVKLLEEKFKREMIDFLTLQGDKNNTIIHWDKLRSLIKSKESILEGKNPFYFKTSFEEALFNLLLNPYKISSACRYTSFDTLFATLYNKKFRMNGICGMNDKSEIDYVENFIYKNNKKGDMDEIKNINNTFILSCCDIKKKDNLTMWRLYGDDAKGVNLIFDIKNKDVNDFYFAKVIYDTKILSLLREIVTIFKKLHCNFIFKKLYYYKHFFKPNNYEEEQEIRLLYKKEGTIKKQWKITQPFNILNPYIEIDIDNFPLELKEIILGPTLKEQLINKNQLKSFLAENAHNNIKVKISSIENYRNLY